MAYLPLVVARLAITSVLPIESTNARVIYMADTDQDRITSSAVIPCRLGLTIRPLRAAIRIVTLCAVAGAISVGLLSGCGVSFKALPTVSLSPASILWHRVNVGNTSGVKQVTVTNTSPAGALPLVISSINLSANFIQSASTCPVAPATLAIGASCQISIAFRPTSSGALTGKLSLTDNATDTPASVSLTATGGIGFLLFNPTSMSFPGVSPTTTSQPKTATLTNEASTPVTIARIWTSGHFAEGDDCPASPNTLAPGGSCNVSVESSPVAAGAITGSVNVEDSFGNVTQLYLSGSDQGGPDVSTLMFTPSSLLWGKVTVGQTSAVKSIMISNFGSSSVSFSDIAVGKDFEITASTCPTAPASLGAGASCTISIAFRPTVAGTISELLTLTNGGGAVGLSLRGTGTIGDLLFSPTSLLFAGVTPGQVSATQTATLTNETSGSVQLSSITTSGHFKQTNNCGATLAAQASCTFNVASAPIADGTINGSINIKDGLGNTAQLFLKGQGGGVDQVLSFSPNPITWGTIALGQTSGSKTLTVNNGQTVPLTIYSMSIGQDFIIHSSTCPTAPTTVPAGTSCTISLAFRPDSSGMKTEDITFSDDAPGGNQSVQLIGTGTTGALIFNPTSLMFAGVTPNSISQPQTATLSNTQATGITLSSITLSGHFAETNDCPGSLPPNGTCTFTVTSNPVIDGPTQGSVNVTDGSGTVYQLYLSGMGGVPITNNSPTSSAIAITPQRLEFGTVIVGQTSTSQNIQVANSGGEAVSLSPLHLGPEIVETATNCPAASGELSAGAACNIAVAFRPQLAGPKNQVINFDGSKTQAPMVIAVHAIGQTGPFLLTPGSLMFQSSTLGVAPPLQSVVLSNRSSAAIDLRNIEAIGPFAQANNCPKQLQPGARCNIEVFADFQVEGDLTGVVNVTDGTGVVVQIYLRMTNTPTRKPQYMAPGSPDANGLSIRPTGDR